ncbi:hypothetical protein AKJ40_01725 [candidate division MSBL1 archaeon SCGC-AAA259M10]|uniref:Uncharacterized protein n=1 Tax=candidate division MSBL1 archaeon SCGC-AAA259M10 TaxID=1698270 RepID=A0A133V181_9EURY|nr:hypothetical protein AKJ40_01725 [candidate division MSBL1 archaeon SCGC-AAA259M10]
MDLQSMHNVHEALNTKSKRFIFRKEVLRITVDRTLQLLYMMPRVYGPNSLSLQPGLVLGVHLFVVTYEEFPVNKDTLHCFSVSLKISNLGGKGGAMGSHLFGVCPHFGITPRLLSQSHAV